MTQPELAAFVQTHLAGRGIEVVLSGGAAAGVHSRDTDAAQDVDLVNLRHVRRAEIARAMGEIGFLEVDSHFRHPSSPQLIEFPPGPLAVGGEPVRSIEEVRLATGRLRLISATDSVKDRLATFYHWRDRQGLIQAILVARQRAVDLAEVERWSRSVGKEREFRKIKSQLVPAVRQGADRGRRRGLKTGR